MQRCWTNTGPSCRWATWCEKSWRKQVLFEIFDQFPATNDLSNHFRVTVLAVPPLRGCNFSTKIKTPLNSPVSLSVGDDRQVPWANGGSRASPGYLLSADWGKSCRVGGKRSPNTDTDGRLPAAQVWKQKRTTGGKSPVTEVRSFTVTNMFYVCVYDQNRKLLVLECWSCIRQTSFSPPLVKNDQPTLISFPLAAAALDDVLISLSFWNGRFSMSPAVFISETH